MPKIVAAISQSGLVLSLGTLATDTSSPEIFFKSQNGPTWPDTVPPGKYIFVCDVRAMAGAKLTITIIEYTDPQLPALPLASQDVNLPEAPSGTVVAVKQPVHFEVA
jgi:hypothetical protein